MNPDQRTGNQELSWCQLCRQWRYTMTFGALGNDKANIMVVFSDIAVRRRKRFKHFFSRMATNTYYKSHYLLLYVPTPTISHACFQTLNNESLLIWSMAWNPSTKPTMTKTFGTTTHWGRDKMAAIFQTTLSNAFAWMKMYILRLRFHWSLFTRVQLTSIQHCFR